MHKQMFGATEKVKISIKDPEELEARIKKLEEDNLRMKEDIEKRIEAEVKARMEEKYGVDIKQINRKITEQEEINDMEMRIELSKFDSKTSSNIYKFPISWGNIFDPQHKLSKTEQLLEFVLKQHITNMECNNLKQRYKNKKIHIITFLFTNNSLLEGKQLKFRANKKLGEFDINIGILSHEKKKKGWKNGNELIRTLSQDADDVNKLPNIIICCTNNARTLKDQRKIFNHFKNWKNKCGYNFIFNYCFDEADSGRCMPYIRKFLKLIKKYKVNNIDNLLFTTATPLSYFWNKLQDEGITKLLNLSSKLDIEVVEEAYQGYRNYLDHEIDIFDSQYSDPRKYIEDCIAKNPNILHKNKPNIIFAPAKIRNKSHQKLTESLLFKEYHKLILNGQIKSFIDPNGNITTIEDFNKLFGVKGELRDTLRKWKELNPMANLVITGNILLERGLTFNTNGFNFTHVFLSNYHSSNMGKLIQTIGRCCGNKEFVKTMIIVCTTKINCIAHNYFEKMYELNKTKPEEFTYDNFKELDNIHELEDQESYRLHYRIFNDISTAKEYGNNLKHVDGKKIRIVIGRRKRINNEEDNEFICDSLNTCLPLPRSLEDVKDRLKKNLYRYNKKKGNNARSTMFICYNNPPVKVGEIWKGGDNSTIKYIIPIPYQLDDEDEDGLPNYVKKFDKLFQIPESKRYSIISKKQKNKN